jgi:hypothetical protein
VVTSELIELVFGAAMGQWDICFANGEKSLPEVPDPFDALPILACGMRVADDDQTQENGPSSYPARVSIDGVLVDDSTQSERAMSRLDVVTAVDGVLEAMCGDRSSHVEAEIFEVFQVDSISEYFRRPAVFLQSIWRDILGVAGRCQFTGRFQQKPVITPYGFIIQI